MFVLAADVAGNVSLLVNSLTQFLSVLCWINEVSTENIVIYYVLPKRILEDNPKEEYLNGKERSRLKSSKKILGVILQ